MKKTEKSSNIYLENLNIFFLGKILAFSTDTLGAVTIIQSVENNTVYIHYLNNSVVIVNLPNTCKRIR